MDLDSKVINLFKIPDLKYEFIYKIFIIFVFKIIIFINLNNF